MDPATVIGIVAACSSLVKTCGSVVNTMHTLLESYKGAELSILSITEECEIVRFAWSSLEDWVRKNLNGRTGEDEALQRLQRSVYAGQLIMAALEDDLAKAIPKTGDIRRRVGLIWNETLFRGHQDRMRGQISALQLLLQVVSMYVLPWMIPLESLK